MRPAPPEEKIESLISKPKKDNKRKRSSKLEDPQNKAGPARRRRKNVIINVDIDSVHQFMDDENDEVEDSTLVTQTKKSTKTAKPTKTEVLNHDEGTSKENKEEDPESPDIVVVPQPSASTPKGGKFQSSYDRAEHLGGYL